MTQLYFANNIKFTHSQKMLSSFLMTMLILLISLLTGCDADKESSTGLRVPTPIIACEILNSDEVETIIGAPVAEPRKTHKEDESSSHWMSMCNYYSDEKQIGFGVSITPSGREGSANEAYSLHLAEFKETLGNDYSLEVIDGLGDSAGWDKTTKQLTLFQGPLMLIIGIVSPKLDSSNALELSKQFAEKLLAKLSLE